METEKKILILSKKYDEFEDKIQKMTQLPFKTIFTTTLGDFIFRIRKQEFVMLIYINPKEDELKLLTDRAQVPTNTPLIIASTEAIHLPLLDTQFKIFQITYPILMHEIKNIYEALPEADHNNEQPTTISENIITKPQQEPFTHIDDFWQSRYVLHREEIDIQHKWFFDFYKDFLEIRDSNIKYENKIEKYFKSLMELRHYSFLHFYTEEETMLHDNYTHLVDHIESHNEYLHKQEEFLNSFIALYHDYKFTKKIDEIKINKLSLYIADFVGSWVGNHIMSKDAKYFHKNKKQ